MRWHVLIFLALMQACSGTMKEHEAGQPRVHDSQEVIRQFIYGLWSLDSGNILSNEGYYFRPDGTVDFVASEQSGKWSLNKVNKLTISVPALNQEYLTEFNIDSISLDRMRLTSENKTHLFRKVPFGMDNEGNVLQGFSGSIAVGESRSFSFNIPSAKKIALRLNSDSPDVLFHIYRDDKEISTTGLREWSAIMIRSGRYEAIVTKGAKSVDKNPSDFDLKILGY